MSIMSSDQVKRIWTHKLTKDFNADETFSIYVDSPFCHMPFCKFCIYKPYMLDGTAAISLKDKYYDIILIEQINDFGDVLSLRQPDSVYFGGGTSSLMTCSQMDKIFTTLDSYFDFRGCKEKHFELNPLSTTIGKLDLLLSWGFTHFTFGIQTLDKDVLKYNNRINPSLDSLRKIFSKLEESGAKYNVDLLAFIYRDNLDEDLKILRNDLELLKCEFNPKRITIFPNYRKFPRINVLKATGASETQRVYFEKLRRFRQTINDFADASGYVNIHVPTKDSSSMTPSNCLRNPMLVRNDCRYDLWKIYTSTHPKYGVKRNSHVLALGGYGKREPYSYISNRFWYTTSITESAREFKIGFADINY